MFKYPREPEGEQRPPTDLIQRLARQGPHHTGAVEASQLVVAGVFERFPKLRIYWAETMLGGCRISTSRWTMSIRSIVFGLSVILD